jgi:hypothetical protein
MVYTIGHYYSYYYASEGSVRQITLGRAGDND